MDIAKMVEKQREFFVSGKTLSVDFRLEMLNKLKTVVMENEDRIADALKKDLNKSVCESYMMETSMVLIDIDYAIKHIRKWTHAKTVPTTISQFPGKSFIVPEPYGVALIIAPWNFPVQLCLEPLTGAIAAGDCAIVKPSSYTKNASAIIKELVSSIFPEEYVAVVEGGREENNALLEQKFDYIFFTGSIEMGKHVMECASKHLTPVSLELGGKSPVIMDKTADIALSAKRIAFGKYINAGQTCVAPDYLLIHEDIRDRFIEEFKKAVASFYPNGDFSTMPTIVNDKHYKRIMQLIEGEDIVIGGKGDSARKFIEPTLLNNVTWNAPVMQEEIFGPVLPIITYKNIDDAIMRVISRPKPLALYLFSTDKAVEKKVLSSISFGGGCINDTIVHLVTPHMGFGGVGDSGMGSYHGKQSFDAFTHYKSILKKHALDLPLRYQPYTEKHYRLIRMLMK